MYPQQGPYQQVSPSTATPFYSPQQAQYNQPYEQAYQQPYQQPQFHQLSPPPPAQYQGPIVIQVGQKNNDTPCRICSRETQSNTRRKVGCVAIFWGICLVSACMCCLPCLMDGCKDTEIICAKCNQKKADIKANCC